MINRIHITILCFFVTLPLQNLIAPPLAPHQENVLSDELVLLDALINSTEKTLLTTKKLRKQIHHYLTLQDRLLADPNNKERCLEIVHHARKILLTIEKNHLQQAFSQQFLGELSLFADIAHKPSVPKAE